MAALLGLTTGCLLLSYGLRAGRLGYQSLWYDEGSSIYLARQSLPAITTGTAHDIHPPLYYYLLHFWMIAAGQSEYAVRSLSLLAGVLLVPLLLVTGRRLLDWRAGWLAALAGGVSPLAIYYSQETRMYAQVTLFGLLSTYLLLRASAPALSRSAATAGRQPVGWLWAVYGAAAAACLYSQYVGALTVAFQGLFVLLSRRRSLLPFCLSAGTAVVLFGPWLAVAGPSLLGWPSTNAFLGGPRLFPDAAFRYALGLSARVEPLTAALAIALLVVAGQALLIRPRRTQGPWLLAALYLGLPLLAMFLLGYRKPLYNPKFALLALPGYLLLLGLGLRRMGRALPIGLALLLAPAGYALHNYYADPEFARDDYRGVARFIETSGRPGDAIILDAPGQEQIFPYYYHGSLPRFGLPQDRPLDQAKTATDLSRLTERYRRLWLVLYGTNGSDPNGYVERWLAGAGFEVQNQWFGDVRLAAFAAPSRQPPASHSADATLGGFARLTGYTLTPQPVPSGDVLQLGLHWLPLASHAKNEKVFSHVIDGDGSIWAQRDSDPVGGARPTTTWRPGEQIADNYGLLVLPGTPPGRYQVEIGMYDPADPARRLPVTSGGEGDRLLLGDVQVGPPEQPPSLAELRIPHSLERPFGTVRLLGYGLTLVGQDTQRTRFRPGDELALTLFWQSVAPSPDDRRLSVELSGGPVLFSGPLLPGHPTSTWREGDRWRDQHRLRLSGDIAGGRDLIVRLDGGQAVRLARISVQ